MERENILCYDVNSTPVGWALQDVFITMSESNVLFYQEHKLGYPPSSKPYILNAYKNEVVIIDITTEEGKLILKKTEDARQRSNNTIQESTG